MLVLMRLLMLRFALRGQTITRSRPNLALAVHPEP